MAVRFLLGPAGSGKTHACFQALRDHERRGEPAIYLVPEQFTYSADRELLETNDLPGLRHVRVFSFSRLAWWLRERTGASPLPTIDEAARTMLLRSLLDGMDPAVLGPMASLRHRTGVLRHLSRFIGEVRNHGPRSFLEGIELARDTERGRATPRTVLSKLETLGRIYEGYAKRLAALERSDPEERLRDLEPLIAREAGFLATAYVYVDGFLSWTRREAEVLVALAGAGADLSIALCCDPEERDDPRVPFRPVFRSLYRLEERLARVGIEIATSVTFEPGRRFRDPGLKRLEREIYSHHPPIASGAMQTIESPRMSGAAIGRSKSSDDHPAMGQKISPVDAIELLEARDRRQEVTLWARRIDRWLRLESPRADGSSREDDGSGREGGSSGRECDRLGREDGSSRREGGSSSREDGSSGRECDRSGGQDDGSFGEGGGDRDSRRTEIFPTPGEIAVLLRDVDPYRDLVREIFPRYDIPFFLDEKQSVLAHPEVRLLLGALEIALSDWRRDAVIAFLRNPLLGVALPLVDVLENRSREFGRDFEHWYSDHWEDYAHPARASFHDPSKDPLPELPGQVELTGTDMAEESETDPLDLLLAVRQNTPAISTQFLQPMASETALGMTNDPRAEADDTTSARLGISSVPVQKITSELIPEITSGMLTTIERTEALRLQILRPLHELFERWKSEDWTGAHAAEEITSFLESKRSHPIDAGAQPIDARGHAIDPRVRAIDADVRAIDASATADDEYDVQVRTALERLLADAGSMWSNLAVSIEEFARSMREGLLSLRLGVTPIRMDQVLVGDVQRSRVLGIRHAVIGGVNEGMFPRSVGDDPILNERDRSALSDLGVPLGPTALERQEEEAYLFYIALTRAAESLLVTWSATDALGRETPASLASQDLQATLDLQSFRVSAETRELAEVQSSRELGRHLLSRLAVWTKRPVAQPSVPIAPSASVETDLSFPPALTLPAVIARITGVPADPSAARVSSGAASLNEKLALSTAEEEMEKGRGILHRPEIWLPPDLLELVFEGSVLESSVSRLQEFAGCPFQSFARNQLHLAARPEARVSPLETGTLAHTALEHVFADPPERIPDLSRRLLEVFAALEQSPDFHGFRVDEASRYRWGSTRRALLRYLFLEAERMRASPYQILARELRFGMGDAGLEIPLPDGRRLRLRGQIDRVDLHREDRDSERPRALVIDYKRSARSGLPRSLEDGADLQLAVYMLYLRDVRGFDPVAGLYVPVVPSPRKAEERVRNSRNRLDLQAHGVFLKDEAPAIDGGVEFLVSRGPQYLADRTQRDALLGRARDYLASYAATQRRGWIEPRPLLRESRRPCERCDYAGVCRFRREIDPDRRSAMEGMVVIASTTEPASPMRESGETA